MKRIEITGKETMDVKRLHLPVTFKCKCPKCGELCEVDLGDDQLSYPKLNVPESIGVFCHICEEFFDKNIIIRIAIELPDDND